MLDFRALSAEAWKGLAAYLSANNLPSAGDLDLGKQASIFEMETRFITALRALSSLNLPREHAMDAIDEAIRTMAASLHDEHTAFIPARAWEITQSGRALSYGYQSTSIPDSAERLVREVYAGGSAEAAGLRPGDVIFEVEGQAIAPGTPLSPDAMGFASVTVRRGAQTLPIRLRLEPIVVDEFRPSLLEGDIGYLRLLSFPVNSSCEVLNRYQASLERSLKSLTEQGARGWVLDLRNNPGGSLGAAAYLLGRTGVQGLVATLRYRDGSRRPQETLANNGIGSMPLAVLVDERSASAAEIVAGALQESRRGRVVGAKTTGAVVAAAIVPIAGGGLEFTVARVEVGPANKVFDKTGVMPDTPVALNKDLLREQGKDSQLQAAIDYVKQKLAR